MEPELEFGFFELGFFGFGLRFFGFGFWIFCPHIVTRIVKVHTYLLDIGA